MELINARALLVGAKIKFLNNQEMQEGLSMGISALDKQMAKHPIIEKWSPALCPCCKAELSKSMGDGYYKHWDSLAQCPECGQRLEWNY